MNQEKFGQFIKEIRKKNNLTQKQLADKYHVTYQAVSKWENGKNMPDTALIKKMSEDFDVSLDELFEGEYKEKKDNKRKRNNNLYILGILIILFVIILIVVLKDNEDSSFEFKKLTTTCEDFKIIGNIAYNNKKSAISISKVEYCGGDDNSKYTNIECTLYESHDGMEQRISSYSYRDDVAITLEEFLEDISLDVDDYEKKCDKYTNENLYLLINASNSSSKITTYRIPLNIEESCDFKLEK